MHDPTRRAARTFGQVFFAVFAVALLGWLGEVVEWSETAGQPFPPVGVLGKAAIGAAAAAASAVVTWAHNALEDRGVVRARK